MHADMSLSTPQVSFVLLGGMKLTGHDERVMEFKNRKARAMLGYLSITPTHTATREQLVGLLWSETSETRARGSLRQTVKSIRDVFVPAEFQCLQIGRSELSFVPTEIQVDVVEILKSLDDGKVDDRLLVRSDICETFMAGLDDLDPAFRNWLIVQRENLRQRIVSGLESLIACADLESSTLVSAATAILQIDQTHEGACRFLMEYYTREGDTAAALNVYNKLWKLLQLEYDMEPSARTRGLVAAIKLGELNSPGLVLEQAEHAVGNVDAGNGNETRTSIGDSSLFPDSVQETRLLAIVVDQFDIRAVADTQRHLCIGFRSELIAMLVKFREWTVIDSMGEGSSQPDPTRYDLRGQLYQDNETVFLSLQLQNANTGGVVWSDRFELNIHNFFSTQRAVAHKITYSLNVHISQERLRRVADVPDVSLDLYDRWLRGQALFLSWSPESRQRSTHIFNSLIEDAPDFARAYSSLVATYNSDQYVYPGHHRSEKDSIEALELARKAVQLDPLDSRSQLHLAWAQTFRGEYSIGHMGFKLACDLNPFDPWTVASAAGGFAFTGDSDAAVHWSERALTLAIAPIPMVWAYTGLVRFVHGDYNGCLLAASQSEGGVIIMDAWKVAALSKLNRHDEASVTRRQLHDRISSNWFGRGPCTGQAAVDWIISCFPISNRQVLKDFKKQLIG